MGVYFEGELKYISRSGLIKMRESHKKDLAMYHLKEFYPNRQRDIEETEENIKILSQMIACMPSDDPIGR